jgi:16S rRNA (uracil1498-N3)-methyltransferase
MTRRGNKRVPRMFVPTLAPGVVTLPTEENRHVRRVLRLGTGDAIRLFDADGYEADGTLTSDNATVGEVIRRERPHRVTVAAAVPKGERADWLVEKLGELGVVRWVPLRTEHGGVEPGGGKIDRWRRRAIEAAKQADTPGVMRVDEPTPVRAALAEAAGRAIVLLPDAAESLTPDPDAWLFVGPEGGWSAAELAAFADVRRARLGESVLRIETAAVVAAAICGLR